MSGGTLAQVGGVVRKVKVHVAHAAAVVRLAYLGVDRERETAVDGVGGSQFAVAAGADGGTRDDIYLKGTTGFVLGTCTAGYFRRDALRRAGRSETAHAQCVTVADQRGCFLSCDFTDRHK